MILLVLDWIYKLYHHGLADHNYFVPMKTIIIANTTIPIKFGMFVLGTFLRERKLKLSDLSLLGEDLLLALELAFTGVEHGYKA